MSWGCGIPRTFTAVSLTLVLLILAYGAVLACCPTGSSLTGCERISYAWLWLVRHDGLMGADHEGADHDGHGAAAVFSAATFMCAKQALALNDVAMCELCPVGAAIGVWVGEALFCAAVV